MVLNMRSKFNRIKEKYFIEDRITERWVMPSANVGWLPLSYQRGGVAV